MDTQQIITRLVRAGLDSKRPEYKIWKTGFDVDTYMYELPHEIMCAAVDIARDNLLWVSVVTHDYEYMRLQFSEKGGTQ